MQMTMLSRRTMLTGVFSVVAFLQAGNSQMNLLPKPIRQQTPEKVVEEHLSAFNACDWNRIMAQYPQDIEFLAPNGVTVRGRQAVGRCFQSCSSLDLQEGSVA
jgi:hypothetical protein